RPTNRGEGVEGQESRDARGTDDGDHGDRDPVELVAHASPLLVWFWYRVADAFASAHVVGDPARSCVSISTMMRAVMKQSRSNKSAGSGLMPCNVSHHVAQAAVSPSSRAARSSSETTLPSRHRVQ